jgi:hypothetical protein
MDINKRIQLAPLCWEEIRTRLVWCGANLSAEFRYAPVGVATQTLDAIRNSQLKISTLWEFDSVDDAVWFAMNWVYN